MHEAQLSLAGTGRIGQQFDRYFPVQQHIVCPEDDAHSPLPELCIKRLRSLSRLPTPLITFHQKSCYVIIL